MSLRLDDLQRRYEELVRRHRAELRFAAVLAGGGGIAGLVRAASEMTTNHVWLVDTRHRVVARSTAAAGFRVPDVDLLLAEHGPVDLAAPEAVVVGPAPGRGLVRRHLLMPVARDGALFAWLVVAEVPTRFSGDDLALAQRLGFHLATEYAVQRRVARASWQARASLARQLVRGSVRGDDLSASADYLGVQVDADRVIVYVADGPGGAGELDEEVIAERVAARLGCEVLGTRGTEGTILLVEVADGLQRVSFVAEVKETMSCLLTELDLPGAVVGVSAVARPGTLQRAYRETREVVLCVDRFASCSTRVIAVDDLGPARLFVANSDTDSVRRYVRDVLGALLEQLPGSADLLRTLQTFFDTGRSVRESSARLGIHENTVRLRLAKVHDLTGLDVAADANDQLSAQTALLVLRLEGHPAIPSFDERSAPQARTAPVRSA